ncbi:hypothetical protein mRhiFer1_009261 [Rhinolophus ferrumequinum]|uniref:Uncharacterized protein n=1 Tax=Rhinolophus ferrumequinum TaxID=59479 RepID=A0A7J7S7Z7_RHIFE|nr:hypothetical protein mRhiFer1_009261 [Rhinolophus ferrumequinum]
MPGARQRSQPQCKACQYHGSRKPGSKDRKEEHGETGGRMWEGRDVLWGYILEQEKITENIHYKGNHGILDEATSLAVLAQPVKGNIPAPLDGTGFAPSVHRPEPVAGMMAQHDSRFCSWIHQEGWTIDPSGPFKFLARNIDLEFGK